MNCPVCNRNNAVSLSICPSCGAMVHDSVREELIPKVNNAARQLGVELMERRMISNKAAEAAKNQPAASEKNEIKSVTTDISAKPTSPTLVEFHNKNAAVPEWRLQLQNVVRQRQECETVDTQPKPLPAKNLKTNGATALKADVVQNAAPVEHKNSTLSSALERIQKSRQQFLEEQKPLPTAETPVAKANKNYPFYIAGKKNEATINAPAQVNQPVTQQTKPTLAPTYKVEHERKLDTNKLPPLPVLAPTAFESQPVVAEELKLPIETKIEQEVVVTESVSTTIEVIETSKAVDVVEVEEIEEYDDRAPFSMRFNAGFFDLIIGSFTSLILLSPFILWGGNWLSVPGVFAFIATCSIVMFMYLTTAIGLYGKTIGMRLFSIEVVDIESEEFPTFHQAAVSSSVYLLSLVFGGIGFLTLFFNEDRRAVHDLVSGTIIVKEE